MERFKFINTCATKIVFAVHSSFHFHLRSNCMQTESLKTKKGNKKDSLSVHKIFLNYKGLDTVRKICQYCTRPVFLTQIISRRQKNTDAKVV